jgi:hypothetical protein
MVFLGAAIRDEFRVAGADSPYDVARIKEAVCSGDPRIPRVTQEYQFRFDASAHRIENGMLTVDFDWVALLSMGTDGYGEALRFVDAGSIWAQTGGGWWLFSQNPSPLPWTEFGPPSEFDPDCTAVGLDQAYCHRYLPGAGQRIQFTLPYEPTVRWVASFNYTREVELEQTSGGGTECYITHPDPWFRNVEREVCTTYAPGYSYVDRSAALKLLGTVD